MFRHKCVVCNELITKLLNTIIIRSIFEQI